MEEDKKQKINLYVYKFFFSIIALFLMIYLGYLFKIKLQNWFFGLGYVENFWYGQMCYLKGKYQSFEMK